MLIITDIHAREVPDPRGNPTPEVEVYTKPGTFGCGMVPSGASTDEHEAVGLHDGDKSRHNGPGTRKAVDNVNNIIAEVIIGFDVRDQQAADRIMITLDGTSGRDKLGANAILGVSIAVTRAAADYPEVLLHSYLGDFDTKVPPTPMMNIINGGSHSDAPIAFQELTTVPVGASTFKEVLRRGTEIFHTLKKILKERGLETAVGDEGGFAPKFDGIEDAVETITKAIGTTGYKPGEDVFLEFDCASSEFYDNGIYDYTKFEGEGGAKHIVSEQIDYVEELVNKYPIITIEDAMDENDWDGWKEPTRRLGKRTQLVGDDFSITNTSHLERGIKEKAANSTLIKVNQIDTLIETLEAIEMAKGAGYTAVVSYRSGEAEDSTIADIAVATNAGQIETGSPSRTDCIAKYNQLPRIEDQLGKVAEYRGLRSFYNPKK